MKINRKHVIIILTPKSYDFLIDVLKLQLNLEIRSKKISAEQTVLTIAWGLRDCLKF